MPPLDVSVFKLCCNLVLGPALSPGLRSLGGPALGANGRGRDGFPSSSIASDLREMP